MFQYEVSVLRGLRHPNLVPLLSAWVEAEDVVLEFPWMDGGSLKALVDTKYPEGMSEAALAIIFRDVLQALRYLHDKVTVKRHICFLR